MKYLLFFCLIVLTSCHITTGYYSQRRPYTIFDYNTPIPIYTPNYTGWRFTPRPNYLGNVYNNYYVIPRTITPRTNLPLNTGPRGGRRR